MNEDRVGPFLIMINGEQSVDSAPTLDKAREIGQELCDREPLPCTFAIHDAEGDEVEPITRSDGRRLPELIAAFSAAHAR